MKQIELLELLEQELRLMLENIERVKEYKKKEESNKWGSNHSLVVGELKHRSITLKQRLTMIQSINTYDLVKNR
jgi:hypothetical protein